LSPAPWLRIVGRRNARNSKRLDLERPALQALPPNRTTDYEETIVTVTMPMRNPHLRKSKHRAGAGGGIRWPQFGTARWCPC
jgi:hypothetical protein